MFIVDACLPFVVVRCSLFVVRCWLFVVSGLPCGVSPFRRLLFVASCLVYAGCLRRVPLLLFVVGFRYCFLLYVAWPSVVVWSLLVVGCLMLVGC